MALDRVSLRLYRSLVRLARTFDANPALKVGLSGEGGRRVPGRPAAAAPAAASAAAAFQPAQTRLLQALICRNHGHALPEPLDSLVARFLGGSHAHFYWPPPPTLASPAGQQRQQQQQQQQLVLDAVRDAFRQPVSAIGGGGGSCG